MFAVAFAGWVLIQQQAPMVDPKTLASSEEFIEIAGLSIHFVRQGVGKGKPAVLLHGFGGWSRDWQFTLPALAREREVLAFDLPGWGLSAKPSDYDYSLPSQANFTLAVLDHFGLDRVDFVGNSMGGAIAIQIALDHPERARKLVLIDSAGYREFHLKQWASKVASLPLSAQLVQAFLPNFARVRYVAEWLCGGRAKLTRQAVEAHFVPLKTDGMAAALVAMVKTLRLDSIKDRIAQVPQATLILWGEKDPLMPVADARRFHHDIERSQLVIFPDAGHVPQEEIPEQVNPLLIDFLNSREGLGIEINTILPVP